MATIKIAGAGLGFFFHVAMARLIGDAEYGVFAYCVSIGLILAIPAKVGLDTATLRFLPRFNGLDPARERGFLIVSGMATLAASALVAGAAVFAVSRLASLESNVALGLLVVTVFLPLRSMWDLCRARLQAYGEMALALGPVLIASPIATMSLIWWLSQKYSVTAADALLVQAGVILVLYVISLRLLASRTNSVGTAAPIFERGWLTVSLMLCLTSSMQVIYTQSDIVVLGMLMSPTEISGYVAAAKVAVLAAFGLEIVNFRYAPLIAKAYAQGSGALQKTVTMATRRILFFTFPAVLVAWIYAESILDVFGPGFADQGTTVLRILIIGQLINALSGPVGFVCSMTNQENLLAKVVLASAVLNILGNFVLASMFGLIGAAMATAIVVSLRNLTLVYIVGTRLNVSMAFWRSAS